MDNVTITDRDGTNPGHINRVTLSDDSSRGYWDFEKEIMSRTNMVTVQFQTDADNNDFGWRLIWGEENFIFDKKNLFSSGLVRDGWRRSGVLMSPNFPKPYPTSFSSDNIIRVSPYNTIKFHFTNFSLESRDYVQFSEWGADGGDWGGGCTRPGEPGQQIELTNALGMPRDEASRYLIVRIEKAEEPLNLKEVIAFGYENTPGMKICERRFG